MNHPIEGSPYRAPAPPASRVGACPPPLPQICGQPGRAGRAFVGLPAAEPGMLEHGEATATRREARPVALAPEHQRHRSHHCEL
jgi:hypothetical protein